jgi:hypothetical protein
MSTAVAEAAVLPAFADGAATAAPVLPGQRGALRSVPACAQPDGGGPDDPLRLGRGMRLRLRAAVQALLADPSLVGLKDAPRLAALVLLAKSRAPQGRRDDNLSSIWGAELGRWLGMTESTVHHKVLPVLRGSGALRTRVVTDAEGHPTGLDCLLMPLWKARKGGGATHPLALSKVELATLLRLLEALFGPGWTPEDKEPTPPGLLVGRTGKGAATDRLGLLLMVLNTRASGWLQLCGSSVKKREGRGAATLARLLGCSPAGARKVLARLTQAGVVARRRKETSTRMNGKGRVMLLPVARAYGRALAPVEVVQASEAVFSARPDGACGDQAPAATPAAPGTSGIDAAESVERAADRERPDGAQFHAVHASVVSAGVLPQLSGGFSGVAAWGDPGLPDRACEREDGQDQAADGGTGTAESVSSVVEVGPLRGEKPEVPPVEGLDGQHAAGGKTGGRLTAVRGEKAQQQGRAALPDDLRLRVALEPAQWLWRQLNRWQQGRAAEAAEAELGRLADLLMQPETAPQLLADRLTSRLKETGGEALIGSPFGWLIGRGLVQRRACSDQRCDDGIRLDTGADCENCANVVHIRRASRARIASQVDRELPGLGEVERRQVLEERLREQAALEAEDFAWRREQAAAEQARRDAARAAGLERAERDRAAAAAADAVRQALPCEDCGQDWSAGLCEVCDCRRQTEALTVEAASVAAAGSADLSDPGSVAGVVAHVRAELAAGIDSARCELLELLEPGALESDPVRAALALADNALRAVQQAVAEYRRCALDALARTPQAEAEARKAYATEQNRRWYRANPKGADALAAAARAADTARERTALYLLNERLEQLHEASPCTTAAGAVIA